MNSETRVKEHQAAGTFAPSEDTLNAFRSIVGEKYAIDNAEEMAPYLSERRDVYVGKAALVLRPGSTQEVSEILALANKTGTAIVPQGGNTGLVGGQIPFESGNEVILSLGRLNKVRELDLDNDTVTVEAGVILQNIQETAEQNDRLFPLSLAAEGSCQIGGNLATNAGGVGALAYGTARDQVLGLEIVLADGRIIDDLRSLAKNNTGYDLKNLLVGSEGTLGLITAAVLKLYPKPVEKSTAFVGVEKLDDVRELFNVAKKLGGPSLTSFELMIDRCLEIILKHHESCTDPLESRHPWNVLIEISSLSGDGDAESVMHKILEAAFENGLIQDGTLASSGAQAENIWKIREELSETQRLEGRSLKCDISVPVARIPEFITQGLERVTTLCPGCRPLPFGHYGDGNIHFNVLQPEGMSGEDFEKCIADMNSGVNELVQTFKGSISAEHGIGRMKRKLLTHYRSEAELSLMKAIKSAFDPNGILNPGKLL